MIDRIAQIIFDSNNIVDRVSIIDIVDKIHELVYTVNALEQDKKAIDTTIEMLVNKDNGRFKEGDKVLVRDNDLASWEARIFSHYNNGISGGVYVRGDVWWQHCIPFDIDKWGTV